MTICSKRNFRNFFTMASQLLLEDNIPYPLWSNGPIPGHLYDFPGKKRTANQMAERTMYVCCFYGISMIYIYT